MARPLKDYSYSSFEVPGSTGVLDDDQVEEVYLRDQIKQCQAELYSLIRTSALGQKDPQTETQIEYQRHQLIQLEDQLRTLSSSKPRIFQLIDQITHAIEQIGTDPSTLSFLWSQVNAVESEYNKQEPNQHIVSASIGAMVSLAERLGAEAVDPQAVRTLASFVPSTLTREV
jgi:hypothetical protein